MESQTKQQILKWQQLGVNNSWTLQLNDVTLIMDHSFLMHLLHISENTRLVHYIKQYNLQLKPFISDQFSACFLRVMKFLSS